jgi:predicted nucleotidyltransferase
MTHGLPEHAVAQLQSVLARFPGVQKAVLYGSRAKGNFRPGSDIDLTLHGDALDMQTLARIGVELDDLLLPYRIDLSLFDSIANQDLAEHILRVGCALYERPTRRIHGSPSPPLERPIRATPDT